MPFSTRIRVRFGDADPAGLVYYPTIFHYFHVGLEEFFAACCGKSYERLISEERLGFPTVRSEAEFVAPLRYGDEVLVEVSVLRIGRTSAVFDYTARRAQDGTLCARAAQVHVCMNLNTHRATPIPDKYREAFERQK